MRFLGIGIGHKDQFIRNDTEMESEIPPDGDEMDFDPDDEDNAEQVMADDSDEPGLRREDEGDESDDDEEETDEAGRAEDTDDSDSDGDDSDMGYDDL